MFISSMLSRPYGTFFSDYVTMLRSWSIYVAWYNVPCSSYDERLVRYGFLNLISLRTWVSPPGGQWGREEKRIYKLVPKIDVNDHWYNLRSISIIARLYYFGRQQASQSAHCGWLPSLNERGCAHVFVRRTQLIHVYRQSATLVKEDVHCFGFLVVFSTFCLFPERIRIKLVRWWVYWKETLFL